MARFKVNQILMAENDFVLCGIVLEGQIHIGMQIHVPLNSSLLVTGDISAVKEIDMINHYEISIYCSDLEEIDLWEIMNLTGDELNII